VSRSRESDVINALQRLAAAKDHAAKSKSKTNTGSASPGPLDFMAEAAAIAERRDSLAANVPSNSAASASRDAARGPTTSTLSILPSNPVGTTPSELVVCVVQPTMREGKESPLDAATRTLSRIETFASLKKVDLFILPELSPFGYCEDTFKRYLPRTKLLKDMYSVVDEAFAMWAKKLKVFLCYGTVGWKTMDDGSEGYTIRQKVVDRSGALVASYDKIHLCDYGDCSESQYFVPGEPGKLVSFQIDTFRLGLMICADMRNPDISRAYARDHKVDVLLQPAAFARDCSFRTWKSFRETRAIENSCYFIGANYGGHSYGESSIVPPWVDDDSVPKELGVQNGFLLGRIKRSVLDLVRSTMPFHRQLWMALESPKMSQQPPSSASSTCLQQEDAKPPPRFTSSPES